MHYKCMHIRFAAKYLIQTLTIVFVRNVHLPTDPCNGKVHMFVQANIKFLREGDIKN